MSLAQGPEPRLLALGDSYTIGEGVAAEERWPSQLERAFAGEGLALAVEVLATTGWTTDELAAAMARRGLEGPYELVTLGIGVNDQYRGRPPEAFRAGLAALLGRAIELAGGRAERVLVLSIPDWGVTPFAAASGRDPARIAAEIDAFNAIARAEAEARGAAFVELTALSRELGAGALAADGLHPSAAQYALWVERRILPAVRRALAGGGDAQRPAGR
ncbi:MAG: GDSL-type esterase/lipase family protein [Xanthomonadales bacterium]|nr:GDSL-type esterase/lipase family protein [Xanthomonadales bacterium]